MTPDCPGIGARCSPSSGARGTPTARGCGRTPPPPTREIGPSMGRASSWSGVGRSGAGSTARIWCPGFRERRPMATQSEIELDLDDDFAAVVARATRNLSVEAIRDILRRAEPGEVPCCRRIASNVLLVRRWAARPQRPGEHWSHRDTLELIDAELERMAIPAGERRG